MRDISENIPFNYQNQIFATRKPPIETITYESDQSFSATEFKFEKVIANNTPKPELKKLAVKLRKEGQSYSEILNVVKVAKSTLALWLKEVGLSETQRKKLTQKSIDGQKKAAAKRREQGTEAREGAYSKAKAQISNLTDREIWLICTALYWAEGSKERTLSPSRSFEFSNTDPRMLRIMIYYLSRILNIPESDLLFEVYIHKNHEYRVNDVRKYWSEKLNIPFKKIEKVRFKRHNLKSNYDEEGNLYNGLVRVKVCSSSSLVRYMEGWAQGVDLCISDCIG